MRWWVLISKLVTSNWTGQQTITIHILPNISISKDNQEMKFGESIKYKVRNIFLQRSCRKWAGRPVPDLFLFLKKLYTRSKQVVSTLVLIHFGRLWLGHTIKTNFITFQNVDPEKCSILIFYNISECWSREMLNFDFL